MKKILSLLLIFIILIPSHTVTQSSSLKEFKEDIEREESERRRSSGSGFSYERNDDSMDEFLGECLGAIILAPFVLIIGGIAVSNIPVSYCCYPYHSECEKNFFYFDSEIFNNLTESSIFSDKNNVSDDNHGINKKNYFYVIEGGGRRFRDDTNGYFVALHGRFYKIIGPELEYSKVYDNEDSLEYMALGINIPIFQHDFINPDLYVQYIKMDGMLNREGVAYGVLVHSYPIKPVTLMFRAGIQHYKYFKLKDFEARIGIIFKRYEIFSGWRKFEAKYAEMGGLIYGVRLHL